MAEILVKAIDYSNPDAIKDKRGCYKRGMPVVVMPDGHPWGARERLPRFVVLKLPGISVDRVLKYIEPERDASNERTRRRLWQFAFASMPAVARNKLASAGELTIGAGGDFTWNQVRNYLMNLKTGLSETSDL